MEISELSEGLTKLIEDEGEGTKSALTVITYCLGRYWDVCIQPEIEEKIGFTYEQMKSYYTKQRVQFLRDCVSKLNPMNYRI